jgi:hypothetical protein
MKKLLTQEDVPRWYHLFWHRKKEGLFIRIHRFFLENCEYKDFEPYFREFVEKPGYLPLFDKCESRLAKPFFGINDSISLCEDDGEWMTYQIKIPSTLYVSNFVCQDCEGTGKMQPEEFFNDSCRSCGGERTARYLDYIQIDETCFSLSMLFKALSFSYGDAEIPTDCKQLFTLTSLTKADRGGHSVGGYASPEFMRFLESFSTSYDNVAYFESAVEVMKKAKTRMRNKDRTDRFACYTRGGQITLDCPGNACYLATEGGRRVGDEIGGEITCHNLDSAPQQLMLLCGLAEAVSLYDDWIVAECPLLTADG